MTLADMPWALRTWNCLEEAGLLDRPDAPARLTAPAMLRLKNTGPAAILDFACVAEFVLAERQVADHSAPDTFRLIVARLR
jgi:hypothetical protein